MREKIVNRDKECPINCKIANSVNPINYVDRATNPYSDIKGVFFTTTFCRSIVFFITAFFDFLLRPFLIPYSEQFLTEYLELHGQI